MIRFKPYEAFTRYADDPACVDPEGANFTTVNLAFQVSGVLFAFLLAGSLAWCLLVSGEAACTDP